MSSVSIILADTSSSMAIQEGGGRRRIDILADVLNMALTDAPDARVIAFSSLPIELVGIGSSTRNLKLPEADLHNLRLPYPRGERLPEPSGSTALHLAINLAAKVSPLPSRVIVLSDGLPDDRLAALQSARALAASTPVTFDCFFIGPDDGPDNVAGLGFMQTLALCGGRTGTVGIRSLRRPEALATEIRGLLGSAR